MSAAGAPLSATHGRPLLWLLIAMLSAASLGCGQRGALYLPGTDLDDSAQTVGEGGPPTTSQAPADDEESPGTNRDGATAP